MKSLILTLFFGIFLQQCFLLQSQFVVKDPGSFILNLYRTVAGNDLKSVVISPLSIQTASALAYMGANGMTAFEMANIMNEEEDKGIVARKYKSILDYHANSGVVKMANKMYLDQKFYVYPEFNEFAVGHFYAVAENVNFMDTAQAAKVINKWVADSTNQKIQDLVSPIDLNSVMAVLVNVVYLKGDWQSQFEKRLTFLADFHITPGEIKQVEMMHQESHFQFGEFESAKVIKLGYQNTDIAMYIVLPKHRYGLSAIEASITKLDFRVLDQHLQNKKVDVQLPKFKVETAVDLKVVLEKLGIRAMFTNNADFSELSPDPFKVGKAIHKAIIEVDEKGTEAAAATAYMIGPGSAQFYTPPETFIADHPFLYFLVDSRGTIFFMGRYGR